MRITYECARMPTREMFISFFREVYDRKPSWVNPVGVRVPYVSSRKFNKISVDEYGEFTGWPVYLVRRGGNLRVYRAPSDFSDSLHGVMTLTCDEYKLSLDVDYDERRIFETHTISAHEQIYITDNGTLLIPVGTTHPASESIYLEFLFKPDTDERLKRLYSDGLLVDYSILAFSNTGSISITKQKETIEKEGSAKKKAAISGYNAFSTREIADGSAISALIRMLTSS